VLRPVPALPLEDYTEARIAEFAADDLEVAHILRQRKADALHSNLALLHKTAKSLKFNRFNPKVEFINISGLT